LVLWMKCKIMSFFKNCFICESHAQKWTTKLYVCQPHHTDWSTTEKQTSWRLGAEYNYFLSETVLLYFGSSSRHIWCHDRFLLVVVVIVWCY
jgi:hypothetical protein